MNAPVLHLRSACVDVYCIRVASQQRERVKEAPIVIHSSFGLPDQLFNHTRTTYNLQALLDLFFIFFDTLDIVHSQGRRTMEWLLQQPMQCA